MRSTRKSLFSPKHPRKYVGDPNRIVCRSSWERWFCNHLDTCTTVEKWGSEELPIPYLSPLDGKVHRYFVDFLVKFTCGKILFVEIKPSSQSRPPRKPEKATRKTVQRYTEELRLFSVNISKWEAARKFARDRGGEFVVFTEKELKALGAPF